MLSDQDQAIVYRILKGATERELSRFHEFIHDFLVPGSFPVMKNTSDHVSHKHEIWFYADGRRDSQSYILDHSHSGGEWPHPHSKKEMEPKSKVE